jgi:Flp pilus assembly protein TadD
VSKNESDHRRRSIYLFARRNLRYPIFELFDRPALAESCTARKVSTTAPQSLGLLNSEFTRNAAKRLTKHVIREAHTPEARLRLCYQLLLSRAPDTKELVAATELISINPDQQKGLAGLCLALFNLNEFLYLD